MPRRVRIALVFFVTSAMGVIAWQALRHREPVYQGRPLRSWLVEATGNGPQARKAQQVLQQAGTNTIPYLLRMMRKTDSVLTLKFVALAQRQHLIKVEFLPAENWYFFASAALEALGPKAKDTVPELIGIFKTHPSPAAQIDLAEVFGFIGPMAKTVIPALVEAEASSTNQLLRATIIPALARIQGEPNLVVPVLVKCLSDTNLSVRVKRHAVSALSSYGVDAKSAVPALVDFFQTQPEAGDKSLASKALKTIDPDAAAKAGVK